MSGFDVMRQSQEQAGQDRRFYDAQRYESMRGTGQAVQQFGQQFQQQMQFDAEIGMQRTEQAMRLAEHEQQFQMNALKLQGMQAIDQADLSRAQVEAIQLQNRGARLELDQKEKMLKSYDEKASQKTVADIMQAAGGLDELVSYGLGINESGTALIDVPGGKREQYLESRRGLLRSQQNPLLDRDRTGREIARMRAALEKTTSKEERDRLTRMIEKLETEYESDVMGGATQPQAGAPRPTGQTRFEFDQGMRDQLTAQFLPMFSDTQDPVLGPIARTDEQTKTAVSRAFAVLAEQLVQRRKIRPDMAPTYVMQQARQDPTTMALALQVAGYSDDRIRAYLRSTGIYKNEAEVGNAMKMLTDQEDRLLR